MMKSTLLLSVIGIAVIAGGYGVYTYVYDASALPEPTGIKQIKCETELKACPDGSSVSRVPPLCEFTACPGAPTGGGGVSVSMAKKIEGKFTGSLVDIMKNGGSHVCTFVVDVQNSSSEGTVYVSQGDIRGDFVSTVKALGGKKVASHMLQIKSVIYSWSDTAPIGMKLQAVTPELQGGGLQDVTYGVDPQMTMDYDCKPWTRDESMFAVPSGIQFIEPGVMPTGGGLKLPEMR